MDRPVSKISDGARLLEPPLEIAAWLAAARKLSTIALAQALELSRRARKKPRNSTWLTSSANHELDRSQQKEQGERIIFKRILPARRLVAVKGHDLVERVAGDLCRAGFRRSEEK